jgi:hypothetical protein
VAGAHRAGLAAAAIWPLVGAGRARQPEVSVAIGATEIRGTHRDREVARQVRFDALWAALRARWGESEVDEADGQRY